ncbi:hypothetical protein D6J03_12510 [Legionella taurinensis]|nr:hypothetical protein [Legionella taurinensis]RJT65451.1 hypothetical protein D6J03_12510 [Legionella taurinensis]
MNKKTGIVGADHSISYQFIADQLSVEPQRGIKGTIISRAQIRRALAGIAQAGLIQFKCEKQQLILECSFALTDYFVQKKAITKPSHLPVTTNCSQSLEKYDYFHNDKLKAVICEEAKAVTPLINRNNYIYLLQQFEKFWLLYPNPIVCLDKAIIHFIISTH